MNYSEICSLIGAKYPNPPLGLLTVAAMLPQDWEINLVDANVQKLTDKQISWADIVFSGGLLSQQLELFALIDRVHSFGKKIVLGGPEPSSQPELYAKADYLVRGEAEDTLPLLLEDLARGKQNGVYAVTEKPELNGSPVPRYDLIRFRDYIMMDLQFSRGCPHNCEFCNVIEIFGRRPRCKTTSQLLAELQSLYELGYRGRVFIVDDNFFGNRAAVREALPAMAKWSRERNYPFHFSGLAAMDLADDEEMLSLAEAAPFRYISIGIETPDEEILKQMHKTQNLGRPVQEVVMRFLDHGMAVDTSLILGLDGETDNTAPAMVKCLQESGICMAVIGTLYALPNTQIWRRLKAEGRLSENAILQRDKDLDIDQMTSGLNFQTSRPRREILEDYIRVVEALYDPGNYYRRMLYTGLNLHFSPEFRSRARMQARMLLGFVLVCLINGLGPATAVPFWSTMFKVLRKNPSALEYLGLHAAMYLHLRRHTRFIVRHTRNRITGLAAGGEA